MLELKKFNIVDAKVVRLNSSYPVLKIGYQEKLGECAERIGQN